MGIKDAAKSFFGGLILTVILVVLVPIFVNNYASGYIEEAVGDRSFLMLSSDIIVNLITWAIILGFMLVLGAGGILKRFGIIGILGLVAAYWLLGDVTDAVIPLATLAIVLIAMKLLDRRKKRKGKSD